MLPVFLAAVLGCWTPTSMFSAETRLPLAASAEFSAAPVQELCSKSVSATGLLCFSQTVCCCWLAVLRENLSHNGVSTAPAKMVGALPAGDVLSEGIETIQPLMIFV